MTVKRFLLGLGVGVSIGLWLQNKKRPQNITPENALKKVKKAMQPTYHISGSWIHMVPETVTRQSIDYHVYRGGISTVNDNGTVQYEFLVETNSGTIIELEQL
ncbi:PepSY domain-containing protein [Halalkalibacter sp. APA_J-10(15)]|uniref:PepSY domain-containing protein n=1 Tax=unclassified Halalkalibacter TaxID=2893063 RepID=UPI001FF50A0E|nr:PepSY domain-containing protein [Halalkalibacter sp. APA_J-10(15)]MCK0471276.1 PepSY domain-containing protein [Halalkalibacter sp. APA_J-10(15)]